MVTQIKTSQQIKMERLTGKNSPQHVFNSILWDMVIRSGGVLAITGDDLKKIPSKATLKGDWDPVSESMLIRAILPVGEVVAPDGIIIEGTHGP